jgi:hypothetical protein
MNFVEPFVPVFSFTFQRKALSRVSKEGGSEKREEEREEISS